MFTLILYLYKVSNIKYNIFNREREGRREGESGGERERERDWSVASGDQTHNHNPGMCPDWGVEPTTFLV